MEKHPKPPRPIRTDGWTVPRQRLFIKTLALTGSVTRAAAEAQMSASSAHRLRHHPKAMAFRRAWELALLACASSLREIAFERAINGVRTLVWKDGDAVGSRIEFNDQLLMFLLRRYDGPGGLGKTALIDSLERLEDADDPEAEMVDGEEEAADRE